MKIIDYPIKKPVASMSHNGRIFINIREDVLKRAISQGARLKVWGEITIDPVLWLKTADRREQVFKRPNEPMILRGGYLDLKSQISLF